MANMDFAAAMECRRPPGAVPIWEIEFQAWDAASGPATAMARAKAHDIAASAVTSGHMMLGKELENYRAIIEAWRDHGRY